MIGWSHDSSVIPTYISWSGVQLIKRRGSFFFFFFFTFTMIGELYILQLINFVM
jgi:hypothetical protein